MPYITEGNKMLKEAQDLDPTLTFCKPRVAVTWITVWTFSDASFNITAGRDYGQTVIITGLRVHTDKQDDIYHTIDWASNKQRRIIHSSYGAEILACADADDRGYCLGRVSGPSPTIWKSSTSYTSSRAVYSTLYLRCTTGKNMRQTVPRIRDSFENGNINTLRLIPSRQNLADGLTKR